MTTRFSLRTKILLLIAGTVTILASLLLITLTLLANQQIDMAVRSDVRSTSSMLTQLVRERTTTLRDQSLLLARQTTFKYLIHPPNGLRSDRATCTDTARDLIAQIHADAALITDASGRLLGETDTKTPYLADRAADPWVAAAMRGHTHTGVAVRGGRMLLAVAVPVVDPASREVQATFTAYSAIDSGVAGRLKGMLGSDVAFVYRWRVVGASLPTPKRLASPRITPQVITLGDERYFALYAPLPYTDETADMGFVVLRPYSAAMALYQWFQFALLAVSALALLLAWVVGTAVARGVTRPLDGVVRAAKLLREGGWPDRFDVQRGDEIGLLQSVFNEMTVALRSSQERLLSLIDTDPLTELDNHRRFQERLVQEAKRSTASGEPLSLVLFDLDHFQEFNQQYGHAAGDETLQRVALILRNCLPEVAIVARYGGEEFAALLPQQNCAQAEVLAERVRAIVFASGSHGDPQIALSLSAGCAELGTAGATQPEGLLLAAELGLSRAKQLGRNRVCRFDSLPGVDMTADPYQLHKFLTDGSLSTIQALAAAVDAKDPYTQGHSQRVAQYAADLARHIGLSKADVDLIHTTGTLHDVGKIGVPDAILQKPGRLTPEERAVMETHPVLGEVIVRKAPQLALVLPGVRHHHERWDGKGYPDGLSGESIPHIARILAVADTFDAMTSDRPYREGMSREVALEEIAHAAGTQFDPELAGAFVAMMQLPRRLAQAA